MKDKIKENLNSGIVRVYLAVTLASIILISVVAGNVGAGIFFGGWVGLIAAIAVNELTPGYTMEGSWIEQRQI